MTKNIHFLHPIGSLGIKEVSLSGIRVERLEDRLDPKVPFPHKHDFYQLIVLEEGTGYHQIDFAKHKVNRKTIFLMKPGQVHSWKLGNKIKGFIVEFNLDSLSKDVRSVPQVLNRLLLSPDSYIIRKLSDEKELKELCREMFREFQERPPYSETVLNSQLSVFILKILRQLDGATPSSEKREDRGDRFHRLVEENFTREHRVEFYAAKLALSPKALTMQITRLLGKSPRTIIQERFLLEAKRLLAFSELSIADIGFELGFEDANYFTRFFRLHEKITPAQFRKNLLNPEPT